MFVQKSIMYKFIIGVALFFMKCLGGGVNNQSCGVFLEMCDVLSFEIDRNGVLDLCDVRCKANDAIRHL